VEAVSTGSRITPRLIDALEADRHDLLPAAVYVRGFIRAYCDQVGADAGEALRLYEAQAVPVAPVSASTPSAPERTLPPGRRWRGVAVGSLLLAVLGVAAVLLLGRRQPDAVAGRSAGATTSASRSTVLATPAAPAPSVVPPPPSAAAVPAAPAPSVVPPPPSAAVPAAPASVAPGPVERVLLMRATDTTWVRVQPDGAEPTEERLAPGTVREWRSTGRFLISLDNAGGVELSLDGHALPALGVPGQAVRDATVPDGPGP
jgi:cytoskeletal protein RodZ